MTTFLATATAGAALLALLAGCAGHLSRPAGLPDALHAHGVLPAGALRAAAAAVTAAEGLLGLAGATALIAGVRDALALVLAAAALLFTGYAAYTRHVLASGRGGPCGCARSELPLSGWVTVRAAALAALATTGAVLTGLAGAPTLPGTTAETATAALAAAAFALLLWTLPAALHDPEAHPASSPTASPTSAPAPLPASGGRTWTS
ncbi:methylamine utilization protein MauE [Streptomyces sp. RKND-216]|uniref:MauE/DoxX family redox-associated membrane protein n=1 Tax=Streptomyces sp. RKND-216 TaxID=2562581 RepID=UPI00109D9973|nr:MauE/DoxX family redox-associated membrane protein [Streptomyces sp. RKND-216]THA26437.1 methylamine utilization protein MauE [Streptomyces sp. RKND-216]